MSEYGCITNTRTFQEVAALYSSEMTSVFSGGLVYEYSNEGNGYGLVSISGDTATPSQQFTYLQSAFAGTPNPTGAGGAMTSSPASNCPPQSSEWDVANDDLPAIPAPAEKFMTSGAGPGPGLNGTGSQSAGDTENESAGTATAGSGTVTETAASSSTATGTKKNGASPSKGSHMDWLNIVVMVFGVALGALLL
jgi:hypothetical protein